MAITKVEVSKSIDTDGVAVVRVKGAIITNLSGTDAAPVIDEILTQSKTPKVILNLSNVRYLDSFSFNWILIPADCWQGRHSCHVRAQR